MHPIQNQLISVDLDDTLIHTNSRGNWHILKSAEKMLPKLYDQGYKFHIVTARDSSTYNQVNKIRETIEHTLDIQFDSLSCTTGEPKGLFASHYRCKYLVDDNPEFMTDCNDYGVTPILYGRKKSSKYIACESWNDVYNFFNK